MTQDDKVKIIDFEYVNYNSYLSDIYNLMIESCYDYDVENDDGFVFENKMSDKDVVEIIAFYKYFSQFRNSIKNQDITEEFVKKVKKTGSFKKILKNSVSILQDFYLFGAQQDVLWGLWALLYKEKEGLNFNFMKFAISRHQNFKNCLLKTDKHE